MKRNDTHDYKDNTQIRIIGSDVIISQAGQVIAFDKFYQVSSGPQTRKAADLYYKKHILGIYDDENKITTPYLGYFPEYSPQPGVMVRVIRMDVGFGKKSKVLVAPPGRRRFKKIWVPKGKKVTDIIIENLDTFSVSHLD